MKQPIAFAALLALVLASTACGQSGGRIDLSNAHMAKGSSPIIGGTTDSGDPAVVLVYNSVQGFLCTGTVIAPRVVLSAGHCSVTTETCTAGTCVALAASSFQIAGGTDLTGSTADWVTGVAEVHPHPMADMQQLTNDVSIFVLDADAPVTPLAWQRTVDNSAYAVSTQFKAVGYGISNGAMGAPDTSGVKRTVGLQITATGSDAFQYGSGTTNTCSGDSGGPAIETINGVETVIGTVSYGDQTCSTYGVDMRTDNNADFIAPYADAIATPTPGPSGTPTPAPTGTPGADTGKNDGPFKSLGCDVAGLDTTAGGALSMLIGASLALARRRAKRS